MKTPISTGISEWYKSNYPEEYRYFEGELDEMVTFWDIFYGYNLINFHEVTGFWGWESMEHIFTELADILDVPIRYLYLLNNEMNDHPLVKETEEKLKQREIKRKRKLKVQKLKKLSLL